MRLLAVNCGSSSVKYRLLDSESDYRLLSSGMAERIGQADSLFKLTGPDGVERQQKRVLPDHRSALQALLSGLEDDCQGIDGIGHRVVHGGEYFRAATLIDDEGLRKIAKLAKLAPLHCQPNVVGIEVLQDLLPKVPQVAVFDTAAHSMETKALLYGLPREYYEKHKLRRYGFHGINHSHVANEAAKFLDRPLKELKVITCHLGNGCSVSAWEDGRSIENSMGLTPLEGLVMGTRSGNIDPSIVLYLIEEFGLSTDQVADILNRRSGLLGLCGRSDMREVIDHAQGGDENATDAINVFVYRIQQCIGAYVAVLHGVDVLVFTGGIGENSAYIRARIAEQFGYLGVTVDKGANEKRSAVFSDARSSIALLCIPANEEVEIARETHRVLSGAKSR